MSGKVTAEFSRILSPRQIEKLPVHLEIEATPCECEALAGRFDLIAIDHFEAAVDISAIKGGDHLKVRGTVRAQVQQRCVVTLERVDEKIEEAFEALFLVGEANESLSEEDPFSEAAEPLGPEGLDVGDLAAQHLSLALDPYPRAKGAEFEKAWRDQNGEAGEKKSPFAVLRHLKKGS